MNKVLPVVLCGKSTQIAVSVIAALKPEFDVTHLCLTRAAGVAEIPAVLNRQPVTSENELGSRDYTQVPKAILLGGAYDDDDVKEMRKACQIAKTPLVPWLRPDLTKPTPPLGPAYGKAMVDRIKVKMAELEKEGQLDGSSEEEILY